MTDTDKMNLRKALRNIIAAGAIVVTIGLLCSCDGIHVKQDFDFEITHLPVPSQVEDGEEVEIRFELRHIEGRYDSTRYYMRYFPTSGNGTLVYHDSVLKANDDYRILSDKFRMYYRALSAGEHTLSLVFHDDFGNNHELNLSFNESKNDSSTNSILPGII